MVEEFSRKHLELLQIEREAEIEDTRGLQENVSMEELQRRGVALTKLGISSLKNGLYGKTVISFEPFWQGKQLPAHRIASGDIVGISLQNAEGGRDTINTGVVLSAFENSLDVVCDEAIDEFSEISTSVPYCVIKLANDVAYRRIKIALERLAKSSSPLVHVLFSKNTLAAPLTSISPVLKDKEGNLKFLDSTLDRSQKDAVTWALLQKEVAIVHGPPGTGKTTTVVEIIRQSVAQGLKVLACAPSNVAVDNLVERLADGKIRVVRLGHPARSMTSCHRFLLDARLANSDAGFIIDDIRSEINKLGMKIKKCNTKTERQAARGELKNLYRDLKAREKLALRSVLKDANVILATLTSASSDGPLKHIHPQQFDLVIIDECSQAIEAACWIPLLQCGKCVLAGDHLQLSPTIISETAEKEGLAVTLMERILKLHGESAMRMLTVQYRMNSAIMKFSSEQLYNGRLVAHDTVAGHLLKDMKGVNGSEDTDIPLLMIDTAGCGLQELDAENEMSRANEGEVSLVAMHAERLMKCGVSQSDIAVIAPYNLQVELLRHRLSGFPNIEIKSVDGFQGREKEAVILSLVRSNIKGEVGFLAEKRRINVAVTRARRHLCVICDSETISHDKFLKSFVEYLSAEGEVRSADQYKQFLDEDQPVGISTKLENVKLRHAKPEKNTRKSKPEKPKRKLEAKLEMKDPKPESSSEDSSEFQFEMEITSFLNSKSHAYEFGPTLDSQQRRVVHELAEKLNLQHRSEGEGKDRHIVLWKQGHENLLTDVKTDNSDNSEKEGPKKPTEKMERTRDVKINIPTEKSVKPKVKSVRKKETACGSDVAGEENFDKMLSTFKKVDNTCSFLKCKTSLVVLAQTCRLCENRFCISHSLPEVHGCGDAARRHAREQIKQQLSGNLPRPPKVTAVKHAHLERKLEKTLTDLSHERRRKETSKKTK